MNFDLSLRFQSASPKTGIVRMRRDLHKLVKTVRESGVRHAGKLALLALRARLMRISDRRRETKLGLAFGEHIGLDSLDVGSTNKPHGFSYIPSPGRPVRVLLNSLSVDLSGFTFVDFGSGEGRVLLVAAEFPFREVIGVEFAKELHDAALANIAKAVAHEAQHVKVRCIHADATQFDNPRGDCVLYFYNPFGETVFREVLKNIERTYKQIGNKIYVLYQQVTDELETDKHSNISLLRAEAFLIERKIQFPTLWDRFLLGSHEFYIFESRADSAA